MVQESPGIAIITQRVQEITFDLIGQGEEL
jgi:hypothetical protein